MRVHNRGRIWGCNTCAWLPPPPLRLTRVSPSHRCTGHHRLLSPTLDFAPVCARFFTLVGGWEATPGYQQELTKITLLAGNQVGADQAAKTKQKRSLEDLMGGDNSTVGFKFATPPEGDLQGESPLASFVARKEGEWRQNADSQCLKGLHTKC